MIQIRHGVFETNSSSTHCLMIWPKADYDKARDMNLYIYEGGSNKPCAYTFEQAQKIAKAEYEKYNEDKVAPDQIDEDFIHDWGELIPFSDFGFDYHRFHQSTTTPSGDEMVAFGYYGYDR